MRILLLDIETAPNTAYVWGLFKENIPLARIIASGYVLCWAAKWLDGNEVIFSKQSDPNMLHRIWALLDEADVVVHYNGRKFDIPTLNKEFIKNDMTPPSPYRQIDLLTVVRSQFKFTSNKLSYVAEYLGLTKKVSSVGFETWIACMEGNEQAWNEMEVYNRGDVITLQDLYIKLLPWIKNHPNYSLYKQQTVCPNCGGNHLNKRGTAHTVGGIYQRYRCMDCGTWSRSIKNEGTKKVACV